MNANLTQKQFEKLVSKAVNHGGCFLNQLIVIAEPKISTFMMRMTFDAAAAEDLKQEVLLAVTASISSLNKPEKFWPWLHTICCNKLRDCLRRKKIESTHQSLLPQECIEQISQKESSLPWMNVEKKYITEKIENALAQLKPKERKIIRMRYFRQMKYSEIAKKMNCTDICARVALTRAKASLRKVLSAADSGIAETHIITPAYSFAAALG